MMGKNLSSRSEFGRGLVICLVKFAEHFENDMGGRRLNIIGKWVHETEENRKNMLSPNPKDNLYYGFPYMGNIKFFKEMSDKVYKGNYKKALSNQIELFMNGASDHLYDIEVPKGKGWDKIRKMVDRLQNKSLKIGHGFTDKIWTLKDLRELMELTREIGLEIDKKLGIKADMGEH